MTDIPKLENITNQVRRDIVRMVHANSSGHPGGSLGCAEFMVALYFEVMNHDKNFKMDGIGEDIFYLSNGHISPVWYSVLARIGYFSVSELATFRKLNSRLQGHPDKTKLQILDSGSGALGQGLSIAIGYAIGNSIKKNNMNSFCLIGDGEMQEGQIWESALYAGSKKINNLCVIVDSNKYQNEFSVEKTLGINDVKKKWESFGWEFTRINGHSYKHLKRSFEKMNKKRNKPLLIYADTIKGKGVSYMENDNYWHSGIMKKEQYEIAITEINNKI